MSVVGTKRSRFREPLALTALVALLGGQIGVSWWWANDWVGWGSVHTSVLKALSGDAEPISPSRLIYEKGETIADLEAVPNGVFSYGSGSTWASIRTVMDSALRSHQPAFQPQYRHPLEAPPGTGTSLQMLLAGEVAFMLSSRPLKPEEYQQAQEKGFRLSQIPVGIDSLAVAVHPDLPIKGLTVGQLNRIYTGDMTNWSQVGGPDLRITPYSRSPAASGTADFWVENVLNGEALSPAVQSVFGVSAGLRQLGRDPGGIYVDSSALVLPQCHIKAVPIGWDAGQPISPVQSPRVEPRHCPKQRNRPNLPAVRSGRYPLTRQLFVVIKQDGGMAEQAGLAYAAALLSDEGQQLLQNAGFVRIR